MKKENFEKWKTTGVIIWAIIGIVAVFLGLLYLIGLVRPIFYLFVLTLTIVYVLRPLVNFFEDKGTPRLFAVVLSYVIVLSAMALLMVFLVPVIVEQINGLILNMPRYVRVVTDLVKYYVDKMERYRSPTLDRMIENTAKNLEVVSSRVVSNIFGATLSVFELISYFILAPVLAFYILKDLRTIKGVILELLPSKSRPEALGIFKKINVVAGGFLRGQLLVAVVVGVLSSVALLILGVDYAVLLGFIVGILNIIPYLGPIVGGTLAVIVALLESPMLALWVIVAMVVVQIIDGSIVSPRIVGETVNLHPVLIVFSLLIGARLFGFIGLLLAIPVAAAVKVLIYHFLTKNELDKSILRKGEGKDAK